MNYEVILLHKVFILMSCSEMLQLDFLHIILADTCFQALARNTR